MLIGNKCDLENERQVSTSEGKEKAENYKIAFLETSAMDGTNIQRAFQELIEDVYKNCNDNFVKDANVKVITEGTKIVEEKKDDKNEKGWRETYEF